MRLESPNSFEKRGLQILTGSLTYHIIENDMAPLKKNEARRTFFVLLTGTDVPFVFVVGLFRYLKNFKEKRFDDPSPHSLGLGFALSHTGSLLDVYDYT
jgi:hypothetical protein